MNNYQLYRTNVALGGQLKWDLILSGNGKSVYVSEFHISPISKNISFVYNQNDNLLNNSHTDNVKNFYAKTSEFYKEMLDSKFSNTYPVMINDNLYSNIYDMGCRRSKSFCIYNKQFEYLCPLWIEHLNGDLSFNITVKNFNNKNKNVISSVRLSLTKNDAKYHNKFVEYFNEYIEDAKLDKGDDELINVDFKKNKTTIKGLDVKTGLFEIKNTKLINDLIYSERPLMDNDNLIIKQFENNNLICKQLFNFNICFNMEDIIPKNIVNMLYGKNVVITITALVNGIELEKQDFYTNYEYIGNDSKNVLDYLYDYKCIDLLSKNKFCQSTCHWCLSDNTDYMFNLYKGFDDLKLYSLNKKTNSIKLDKSLRYKTANSPSVKSTEISYNTSYTFIRLNRQYGKIKPMFSSDNILYYKQYIDENNIRKSTYTNLMFSKYTPLYPSINYYGIQKLSDWSYNTVPNIIDTYNEYSWFNDNKFIVLSENINKTGTFKYSETVDDVIYDMISDYYNISDNNTILYLKNMYKHTNNWDYESNDNINNKKYNISLVLK